MVAVGYDESGMDTEGAAIGKRYGPTSLSAISITVPNAITGRAASHRRAGIRPLREQVCRASRVLAGGPRPENQAQKAARKEACRGERPGNLGVELQISEERKHGEVRADLQNDQAPDDRAHDDRQPAPGSFQFAGHDSTLPRADSDHPSSQAIRRLTRPWQWLRWSTLEVVDCSMTSPAPIEAPVQRRGLYEHDSV